MTDPAGIPDDVSINELRQAVEHGRHRRARRF
jgi:hypothetical protein